MNLRPLPRRFRINRGRRRLLRPLLGAALVVAGVLVPLESGSVPDPFVELVGASPVLAQTLNPPYVEAGTPTACPSSPWTEQGSVCVVQTSACPDSPLPGGGVLLPSVGFNDPNNPGLDEFTGFCEERVLEPPGPTYTPDEQEQKDRYDACAAGVGGFVRERYTLAGPPVVEGCRLIHTATCAAGLHRVDSDICRAVQRRTWECPADYIPRNDFNTCYREPLPPSGNVHPACDRNQGAPDLVVQSCPAYVGNDYDRTPTSVDCLNFLNLSGIDMANLTVGSSSKYWCEFDTSYLKIVCHGTNPPASECAASMALCLKRASQTGGCNAIADIIHCRALQAEYSAGSKTVQQLRETECEPCLILPFQSLPAGCADDITGNPSIRLGGRIFELEDPIFSANWEVAFHRIHRVGQDFADRSIACRNVHDSEDYADNRNRNCRRQPVCLDPPRGQLTWTSTHSSQIPVVNSTVIFTVLDVPTSFVQFPAMNYNPASGSDPSTVTGGIRSYLAHPNPTPGDPIIRLWPRVRSSQRFSSVMALIDHGECVLRKLPRFRVDIEELWPDSDEAEIKALFGNDSLDWWSALSSPEQADRISARGTRHSEQIICNLAGRIWCRWSPTRAGYFKASASAAWVVSKHTAERRWENLAALQQDLRTKPDFHQAVEDTLGRLGLDASEAGLSDDLMTVLPPPSSANQWLYTSSADRQHLCPGTDLRVVCTNTGNVANYTQSEPIGIVVHEMRVATRVPS